MRCIIVELQEQHLTIRKLEMYHILYLAATVQRKEASLTYSSLIRIFCRTFISKQRDDPLRQLTDIQVPVNHSPKTSMGSITSFASSLC